MIANRAISCAVIFVGLGTLFTAETQIFTSLTEMVRVDVLVTERGQIVEGLRLEDFEVRDNGVIQDIELASFDEVPLNVVLGLDLSASVSGSRLADLQNAGDSLLERLTFQDRAALVVFNHAVQLRQELTSDIPRLRRVLSTVIPAGATSLVDASYAAMTVGASDVGRSLLILFSDGVDTASWLSPDAVFESARRSDVVVFAVAMQRQIPNTFLEDLSQLTGGALFKIGSTSDLSATFLRIIDDFRRRYLLSYSPRGVSSSGWHRLDVRVKGRRVVVNARAGYKGSD